MEIITKNDNDKKYIFTCPICGTVFTALGREIEQREASYENGILPLHELRCPNCCHNLIFSGELTEYKSKKRR